MAGNIKRLTQPFEWTESWEREHRRHEIMYLVQITCKIPCMYFRDRGEGLILFMKPNCGTWPYQNHVRWSGKDSSTANSVVRFDMVSATKLGQSLCCNRGVPQAKAILRSHSYLSDHEARMDDFKS